MTRGRILLVSLPLLLFLVLALFLGRGLYQDPSEIPSPLLNRKAPAFSLPTLDDATVSFSPDAMLGQVWLLNVWASWCAPCRQEHPVLLALARSGVVPVYGINYKDNQANALKWLQVGGGDPYQRSVMDESGRVGIDYGVYGVPETYVVDKAGYIRYKQTGAITERNLAATLLPLVRKLQAE